MDLSSETVARECLKLMAHWLLINAALIAASLTYHGRGPKARSAHWQSSAKCPEVRWVWKVDVSRLGWNLTQGSLEYIFLN
jgi:hypothetical protein